MAKKDNQFTEQSAAATHDPVDDTAQTTANVALAPIAELQARVEELEKSRPARPKTRLEDVPLTMCNRRHQEVMIEVQAERRGVVEQVTKALTAALGGRATNERRMQKDLTGHAAEALASAKADK